MAQARIRRSYGRIDLDSHLAINAFRTCFMESRTASSGDPGELLRFEGSLKRREAPDVVIHYDDQASMLAAVDAAVDGFELDIASPDYSKNVRFVKSLRRSGCTLAVDCSEAQLESLIDQAGNFEKALGVEPIPEGDQPKSCHIDSNFVADKFDAAAFKTAWQSELASLARPFSRFSGMVAEKGKESFETGYDDLDRLHAALPRDIARYRLTAYGGKFDNISASAEMTAEDDRFRARVNLAGPVEMEARLRDGVASFAAALSLKPERTQPSERPTAGSSESYFAHQALDKTWFKKLCGEIERIEPAPFYAVGTIKTELDIAGEMQREGLPAFRNAVLDNWELVLVASISVSGNRHRLTVSVEPRLDLVKLQIMATDEAAAKAIHLDLKQRLALEPLAEQAYDVVKSRVNYNLTVWNPKQFATVAKDLIEGLISHRPIVLDTYITARSDKGNVVTSYRQLDKYLADVVKIGDSDLEATRIRARGPRGAEIAFTIEDEPRRLRIASSLSPVEFDGVRKMVESKLKVKATAAKTDRDTTDKAPTFFQQIWKNEGFGGWTLLAAGGLVGAMLTILGDRLIGSETVKIISPAATSAQPAKLVAGCVNVVFQFRHNTWFENDLDEAHVTGDIRLMSADGVTIGAAVGRTSPARVLIAPGEWLLDVYVPSEKRLSDAVRITAENPQFDTHKAEYIADCG